MELDSRSIVAAGLVALAGLIFFLRYHMLRQWKREEQREFMAALRCLNNDQYEILLDKITFPSRLSPGEVYRIIHNHKGEYFLYLYTPGSPGVLQPLSKERAMISVRLNG